MRIAAALLALALAPLSLSPLGAAEVAPAPEPAAETASLAAIPVALLKQANVRYGPSLKAKIAVTLATGTTVEVFGRAQAAPEWYVIRFPKQARAWVHKKVVAPIGDTGRLRVLTEGARARDDATLGASVVAELAKGEVLEDRGNPVGDWLAVSIPDAVAYVHGSLLDLPQDLGGIMEDRQKKAAEAEAVWREAVEQYTTLREQVSATPKSAVNADWAGLVKKFDVVIVHHASAQTRLQAKLIRDGIADVVATATIVAAKDGMQAPAAIPTAPQPAEPVKDEPKPKDPVTAKPATGTPGSNPGASSKPLSAEEAERIKRALPKPSLYQAEGILMQNDDFPKVAAKDLVMDANGDVVAFLVVKEGSDLKLSELVYREVGIKGTVEMLQPAATGMDRAVKLVTAVAIEPIKR